MEWDLLFSGAFMFLWMCFPRRCPVYLVGSEYLRGVLSCWFHYVGFWHSGMILQPLEALLVGTSFPKVLSLSFLQVGLCHAMVLWDCLLRFSIVCSKSTVSALSWLLRWLHSSFSKELQGRSIWIRLLSRTVIGLPWPQPCATWSEGSPHSFPNTWMWASLYSSVFSLDSMKPSYLKTQIKFKHPNQHGLRKIWRSGMIDRLLPDSECSRQRKITEWSVLEKTANIIQNIFRDVAS